MENWVRNKAWNKAVGIKMFREWIQKMLEVKIYRASWQVGCDKWVEDDSWGFYLEINHVLSEPQCTSRLWESKIKAPEDLPTLKQNNTGKPVSKSFFLSHAPS